MINDDRTGLEETQKVVTLDCENGTIDWENACEASGAILANHECILNYLNGGGDDAIRYAINDPDACASDLVNTFYWEFSEDIDRRTSDND